jgi:hypothetical protein
VDLFAPVSQGEAIPLFEVFGPFFVAVLFVGWAEVKERAVAAMLFSNHVSFYENIPLKNIRVNILLG